MIRSALQLLGTRRFIPFFVTQFTGAYNDSVFRNALVVLITYQIARTSNFNTGELVAASAGLFILPFFLLSAIGGTLADRYPRHRVIRAIKLAEVLLMGLTWFGFATQSLPILFTALFLTGVQSALFAPVKYAILPGLLASGELLAGNAWVAGSTFVAILAGTLTGTLMMTLPDSGWWVPGILMASSALGYLSSRSIPPQPAAAPDLRLRLNVFAETARVLRNGMRTPGIAWVILAISWFWMLGVTVLIQLPLFTRDVLGGSEQALAGLLTLFTLGVAGGAALCNRRYRGQARASGAPFAALLMGLCFWLISLTPADAGVARGVTDVLAGRHAWVLAVMAIAGGFYIVPLYTLLQQRAPTKRRAQIISCNSIMNALFMAVASILVGLAHLRGEAQAVWWMLALTAAIAGFSLLHVTGGSWRRLLAWPMARIVPQDLPPLPANSLIITRTGNPWVAWALAATVRGTIEIWATSDLTQHRAMRPLRRFVPINEFDSDTFDPDRLRAQLDPNRIAILLPPPGREGERLLLELMSLSVPATGQPQRPLYAAYVENPERKRKRIRPRIEVRIQKCPITPSPTPHAERQQLLQTLDCLLDQEYRTHFRDETLLQCLHRSRQTFGTGMPILSDLQQTYSFGQLHRGLYGLSFLLRRALPATPDTVGVLLPNVLATPVTFFALHASNHLPVMLNYTAGPANVTSACRTAGLTHVISSRQFIETAGLQSLIDALDDYPIVWLEDLKEKAGLITRLYALLRAAWPAPAGDPNDPAVILFTSGSENEPKGVVLSHHNLRHNASQVFSVLNIDAGDHLLLCLPLFHSFGLGAGLLMPLAVGLHCTLYPNPLHYREIPKVIHDLGITVFFSTDSFLNGYAQYASRNDLASLRLVIAGAEQVKQPTRQMWQERFGIRIYEGYGVTEASPVVSIDLPLCPQPGSVGRLVPAIEARLEALEDDHADQSGRGQLWLRGPNIMKGYWMPGQARKLVAPENGWHNTGDIAEIDALGYLTLHGRTKRFAKIGGEMLSLGQIEQLIGQLWPDQRHLLCAVPHPTRGEQLVLLTERTDPDRPALQRQLADEGMPPYACPKILVEVEAVPLLGSGKPDLRRAEKIAQAAVQSPP